MYCAAALLGATAARGQSEADAVYLNGRIYTLDPESSVVTAVAVARGRLIAVGSDQEVRAHIGAETDVVDLAGAAVIPGVIDSHIHLGDAGLSVSRLTFEGVSTVAEALARVEAEAVRKAPGEWIVGDYWTPTTQLVEGRALTAAEIDAVAPDNPVLLEGAAVSANSAAMALAGVDANTPDPETGRLERDAAGAPTGVFEGAAAGLVRRALPPPTIDQLVERYAAAQAVANSFGLTSVVLQTTGPDEVRALQRLKSDGALTLRFSVILPPPSGGSPEEWDAAIGGLGVGSGFGDEWLRLDSVGETPADGGMTYGTALTREAYPHDPDYHGVEAMSVEQLNANVRNANLRDWRYSIHAIGDAAIDRVLDAYEAAGEEKSIADRRFVVIRGSLIQQDQLERMARLGVMLQIENQFMWDKAASVERRMGPDVAQRVFPNRLAIDILGIDRVSQGSDFPTNSMSPWRNLYLAVTRTDETGKVYGGDQAIGREEALRMYTTSGAYASFEEELKGSLEIGKLADMVVLDRDYMTIPDAEIRDIQATMTIVGGRVVFSR